MSRFTLLYLTSDTVGFLLLRFIVQDLLEVSHMRNVGQILNPYSEHYLRFSEFLRILYPLGDSVSLTVDLLRSLTDHENP